MDIKKLQQFAMSNAINPNLFDRIMGNNLNVDDVIFLEKTISAKALIEISMQTEVMIMELQKLGLELNSKKDLANNEYTIKLVDWVIENLRVIQECSEDVGLTDIKIK